MYTPDKFYPDIAEKFGIPVFQTSPPLKNPEHHSVFSLDKLPSNWGEKRQSGMPWETDNDAEYAAFRSRLPSVVTGKSIYECVALPQLQMPYEASEQRSVDWHTARAFAVTASSFDAVSENAVTLLHTKTYPKKFGFNGNGFTEWGTLHEKHAEEFFVKFLQEAGFKGTLEHCSHLRSKEKPYIGFSPDGLLWTEDRKEVDLVEFKCPAGGQGSSVTSEHPYKKWSFSVPSRYMPQIQGSLEILRELHPNVQCVRCWFVVWQPHQSFVTHVPYIPLYASQTVARADAFFHDRFLPACADAVAAKDYDVFVSSVASSVDVVDSVPAAARAAAATDLVTIPSA
jgi:hypothetical protein